MKTSHVRSSSILRHLLHVPTKVIWEDVVNKMDHHFDGEMKKTWVEIKGLVGNEAGKIHKGIDTLWAQSDKMVSS